MEADDFNGIYKYKFVIPFCYIVSWVFMFIVPIFFQETFQKICIIALIFVSIKTTSMAIISIIASYKCWGILNRAQNLKMKAEGLENSLEEEVIHVIIIPNYKEDIELLAETLDRLASHYSARRYIVFLAMEAREQHSDLKAKQLIKEFRDKFRIIGYTHHKIREHELKGKASNLTWCAQHLQESFFNGNNIDTNKVFITVIDSDSWAPQIYFREVEDHLFKEQNRNKRDKIIYFPNQIFTRNHLDVPIFTRTYDQGHSCMHYSNLESAFNIGFPLSNYTLSFNLIKKVGFWDTCPDAIGQDFHVVLKLFWKTLGDVEAIPIYASFNQVNVQTGRGYIEDIQARFWQAERHARTVSDVAYCINMVIKEPFRWRTFLMTYQVFDYFFIPAAVPWVILVLIYEITILFKYSKNSSELISQTYAIYMFAFITLGVNLSYLFYYILKRRATSVLYKLQNQSFLRILEYPLIFALGITIICLPTFVIASFSVLFDGQEFNVAEKVIKREKNRKHQI